MLGMPTLNVCCCKLYIQSTVTYFSQQWHISPKSLKFVKNANFHTNLWVSRPLLAQVPLLRLLEEIKKISGNTHIISCISEVNQCWLPDLPAPPTWGDCCCSLTFILLSHKFQLKLCLHITRLLSESRKKWQNNVKYVGWFVGFFFHKESTRWKLWNDKNALKSDVSPS